MSRSNLQATRGLSLLHCRSGTRLLLGAALCAASAAGSPAFAQQASPASPPNSSAAAAPAAGAPQLENVTVTAEFKKENLQQTPLAITAISAATLEARSQTSLQDITGQAPNVTLLQNGAGGGNSMRALIRGIGQTDFDPAVDPGVGIYIDDVYFATLTGSNFALLDLDRVEVLRGPQGTLAGMNSEGGSVKLYTQKATGSNDGYVEATYGSYDRVDIRASGDFALVPDKLFLRLSGVARRQEGYVTLYDYACTHPNDPDVASGAIPRGNVSGDCKTGTEGGIDYDAVRASLRWLVNDKIEVNWITDATEDNSGSTANSLISIQPGGFAANVPNWFGSPYDARYLPPSPFVNYANFLDPGVTYKALDALGTPGVRNGAFYANPNNTLRGYGSSLTVDWRLTDNLALKSITAYRAYSSSYGDDNSDSPVPLILEEGQFSNNQFSQELRLTGTAFGSLLDYTVGGIFFRQHTDDDSREDDPGLSSAATPASPALYGGTMPSFDFIGDPLEDLKTEAAFLNTSWHPLPKLTLDAGVRFTHEHKAFAPADYNLDGVTPFLPLNPPGNPEGTLNGTTGVFDGSHLDYRLGVDYQWTPTVLTYVSWSTGFKGGGITPRAYYPQQVVPFGIETVQSYEIGVKTQWLDNRLRANLAAFRENYNGVQESANLPQFCVDKNGNPLPAQYANPCGEYINAADAAGQGFELELEGHPVEHLQFDASLSYLDLHVTRSLIPDALPTGSPLGGVGRTKGSAGVQYEVLLGPYGSWTPRVDVTYTPGYCNAIDCSMQPFLQNEPYTLASARLTYWSPGRGWSAALEATNLTDKLYYISKTYTGLNYVDGQIGPPRMWAITLHKQF